MPFTHPYPRAALGIVSVAGTTSSNSSIGKRSIAGHLAGGIADPLMHGFPVIVVAVSGVF